MNKDKCQCLICRFSREEISLQDFLNELAPKLEEYLNDLDANGEDVSFRANQPFCSLEVIENSLDLYIPLIIENRIKDLYLIARRLFFKLLERKLKRIEDWTPLATVLFKFEIGKIIAEHYEVEENKLDIVPVKRFWDGLFQRLEIPIQDGNYKLLEKDNMSYFIDKFDSLKTGSFLTLVDLDLDIPIRLTKEDNKFFMEYMR